MNHYTFDGYGMKSEPVDLRLLGSRPADTVDVFDWRVQLDMAMHGVGTELRTLAEAVEEPEKAEYLMDVRHQAILNSHLARLMLLCSVLREFSKPKTLEAAE